MYIINNIDFIVIFNVDKFLYEDHQMLNYYLSCIAIYNNCKY